MVDDGDVVGVDSGIDFAGFSDVCHDGSAFPIPVGRQPAGRADRTLKRHLDQAPIRSCPPGRAP